MKVRLKLFTSIVEFMFVKTTKIYKYYNLRTTTEMEIKTYINTTSKFEYVGTNCVTFAWSFRKKTENH